MRDVRLLIDVRIGICIRVDIIHDRMYPTAAIRSCGVPTEKCPWLVTHGDKLTLLTEPHKPALPSPPLRLLQGGYARYHY